MNAAEAIKRFHQTSGRTCFLATCDNRQPRIRPMSPVLIDGQVLWLAALAGSPKMSEIGNNPNVEICYMNGKMEHLRLTGSAEVVNDPDQKQRMWDANQDIHRYFTGPDDPDYSLLKVTIDKAILMPLTSLEYQTLEVA